MSKDKRILVVDDDIDFVQPIRKLLEVNGYEVIEARNGKEGIEKARSEKPDLILLDVQLPDIDGLEVVKRIRASEVDGSVSIIALTSYAMPGDREKMLAAGCNGYIAKPIDVKTFISEIERYL